MAEGEQEKEKTMDEKMKEEEAVEAEMEESAEEEAAAEKELEEEVVDDEGTSPEEKKEEAHEAEDDSSEEEEDKAEAEEKAEPVAELDEEKAEEVSSKSDEDEFVAMMKEEDAEKKAEAHAKGEDALPPLPVKEEEEEDISLVKKKPKKKKKKEDDFKEIVEESNEPRIYALRTTANREDQVMSFVTSNAARKKLEVYSVVRPHGMRGYIFIEAGSRSDAEQAAFGVPYARGLLASIIQYAEIEHMLEQVKKEANIQKNDIAEIISGPFKREKCKITRIDKTKEEVVVELLEAAVPIPLTLKIDAVRVIRRDTEGKSEEESS
jgi:transcriptional antiterminator NusG